MYQLNVTEIYQLTNSILCSIMTIGRSVTLDAINWNRRPYHREEMHVRTTNSSSRLSPTPTVSLLNADKIGMPQDALLKHN